MNKLTEHRVTQGLTVRQLAEVSKVSPTTINRLEMGKIKSHPVTIGRLAKALKIPLAELTEFIAVESPKMSGRKLLNSAAA